MTDRKQIEQDIEAAQRVVRELRTIGARAQANSFERGGEQLEVARAIERLTILAAQDESDQGYANHETFLVAMQLAGNMTPGGRSEARRTRALVEQALAEAAREDDSAVRVRVADRLAADVRERWQAPGDVTLRGDLLATALGRVDWLGLAAEQLEQLAEAEAVRP